jgi:hypothetical protein
MAKYNDLTGKRVGLLLVLSFAGRKKQLGGGSCAFWYCLCDCGNLKRISQSNLITPNHTRSCGCLQKLVAHKQMTTYGFSRTRIGHIRISMINRCYNPKDSSYKHYGGRNIKVCDAWLNNPSSFLVWAEATGYSEALTIDRIDVNGNYEPSNCRWTTMKKQQNNRRNNHFITYKGETKTIATWSDETGIGQATILYRIENNFSEEELFDRPVAFRAKSAIKDGVITFNGEAKTPKEWEKITGIPLQTIWARMRMGWSEERTLTTPNRTRRKKG